MQGMQAKQQHFVAEGRVQNAPLYRNKCKKQLVVQIFSSSQPLAVRFGVSLCLFYVRVLYM